MPTFGKQPELTLDLVKKIIKQEQVKSFEDLIKRRLSMIEKHDELNSIMGIPVEKIKALF
jgi:hypothetical protein